MTDLSIQEVETRHMKCKHPPNRLYAWWARDDRLPGNKILCVVCFECNEILRGDADEVPLLESTHSAALS